MHNAFFSNQGVKVRSSTFSKDKTWLMNVHKELLDDVIKETAHQHLC